MLPSQDSELCHGGTACVAACTICTICTTQYDIAFVNLDLDHSCNKYCDLIGQCKVSISHINL